MCVSEVQASFIFALNSQRLCDCNKICVTCKKSLIFKTLIDNNILFACRESLGDCIYVSFYLIISEHKQLLVIKKLRHCLKLTSNPFSRKQKLIRYNYVKYIKLAIIFNLLHYKDIDEQ